MASQGTGKGRWAGRNVQKDVVRHDTWRRLEDAGMAIGPAWSMIPNFVGADIAAWRLAQTDAWKAARTVKTNPDHPQIPVRIRALHEGKTVYTPVPYLTREFPYLRLDPAKLAAKEISFELAATAQGFMEHGERIEFEEIEPLDFCVVGSVAVGRAGGRTGKGAGFADLETGIFRELGIVGAVTPMATTVHSLQLVPDGQVVIESHDSPLDFIATEAELIETGNAMPRPAGVAWEKVRADQFETIPFLGRLRDRMLARQGPDGR
ncbi:MAG: 5-formyltetrahydrofolate cyclo-ligase [Pseudomonadota bacterium]|nr:5-formyltetrahydrofolate cyclo-ligase [Pseudomonadota bacterium]